MASNRAVVTGVKSIDRKLHRLGLVVQKKVARKGIRAGIKVVANEWKLQVPRKTGLMRSAIKVRAVGRKRSLIAIQAAISGKIPGLVKYSKGGKRTFYPAVVEYGRKDAPPNPSGRRAYEGKKYAARKVAIDAIRGGVDEEVRKS